MRYTIIAIVLLFAGSANARSVFVDVPEVEVDRLVELELRKAGYEVVDTKAAAEIVVTGKALSSQSGKRKAVAVGTKIELIARRAGEVLVHDRGEAKTTRATAKLARPISIATACRTLVPRFVATLSERLEVRAIAPGETYESREDGPFDVEMGFAITRKGKPSQIVTWERVENAKIQLECQLSRQQPCGPDSTGDGRDVSE